MTIVDDNQWEPDEEFFLKLSMVSGDDASEMKLGRTSIMEITILNDDGWYNIYVHCLDITSIALEIFLIDLWIIKLFLFLFRAWNIPV